MEGLHTETEGRVALVSIHSLRGSRTERAETRQSVLCKLHNAHLQRGKKRKLCCVSSRRPVIAALARGKSFHAASRPANESKLCKALGTSR